MVLVNLDGTALTQDDPKLMGKAINKWTLEALTKNEFHDVPEGLSQRRSYRCWRGPSGDLVASCMETPTPISPRRPFN